VHITGAAGVSYMMGHFEVLLVASGLRGLEPRRWGWPLGHL